MESPERREEERGSCMSASLARATSFISSLSSHSTCLRPAERHCLPSSCRANSLTELFRMEPRPYVNRRNGLTTDARNFPESGSLGLSPPPCPKWKLLLATALNRLAFSQVPIRSGANSNFVLVSNFNRGFEVSDFGLLLSAPPTS